VTEKERERTGSPTATLRREILLTPALSFTPSLNVSLGNSKLPYEVPGQKNNRLNKKATGQLLTSNVKWYNYTVLKNKGPKTTRSMLLHSKHGVNYSTKPRF